VLAAIFVKTSKVVYYAVINFYGFRLAILLLAIRLLWERLCKRNLADVLMKCL
jgi:hypothetical protein